MMRFLFLAMLTISCSAFGSPILARSFALSQHAPSLPVHMKQPAEAPKSTGVVAGIAALWVAAHLLPLLLNVPPASAVEAMSDETVASATQGGLSPTQYTALAVTAFSILPVPGMIGFGNGNDVYKDKEANKGRFGFKSVDDAVKAARGASTDSSMRGKGVDGKRKKGLL